MWKSRVVVVAFVCGVMSGSGAVAFGQATQPTPPLPTPQPTTRPGNQSAEEMLKQMLQPQGDAAQPLKPAGSASDDEPMDVGLEIDDPDAPRAVEPPPAHGQPLVREGTPLLDRVGRLTPLSEGRGMLFTLESDGRTLADPPMLLLPNRKLMQLEDRVRASYRDVKVSVSGEVTEYRGRNYLLLSRWTLVQDAIQPLK